MKKSDFAFDLPKELIASAPLATRSASRLMHLNRASGALAHHVFSDLPELLDEGDLLVFNDTRVIPARLFAKKPTGGKVEILIERILSTYQALAHLRGAQKTSEIYLEDDTRVTITGRQDSFYLIDLPQNGASWLEITDRMGHMPLPPYIEREDTADDRERYQTVYSDKDKTGSAAAPTAGLHFDDAVFAALKSKGINTAFVTLHVGAGTFQPVRADNIKDHKMHSEYLEVSAQTCTLVNAAKASGKRVIAVGTTSVRCLETAWQNDQLQPFQGETDIFIYPGYAFKCIDGLITNFHLPESSLIMLVSAFAGYNATMTAYQTAVAERYRFFSYGDAMAIL